MKKLFLLGLGAVVLSFCAYCFMATGQKKVNPLFAQTEALARGESGQFLTGEETSQSKTCYRKMWVDENGRLHKEQPYTANYTICDRQNNDFCTHSGVPC